MKVVEKGNEWESSRVQYVERMLSVEEVARNLNCSVYTVYRRLKSGELGGFRDGGTWKIPTSDYTQYVTDKKSYQCT